MKEITVNLVQKTIADVQLTQKSILNLDIQKILFSSSSGGGDSFEFETLQGAINNVNTVFTTIYDYILGSTMVFMNGLLQKRGVSYTESGNKTITFSEPPQNAGFEDELLIFYKRI